MSINRPKKWSGRYRTFINANASRIYKIYHFLVLLLSLVCVFLFIRSFVAFSSIIFFFWNQISTWHTTYTHKYIGIWEKMKKTNRKDIYSAFRCRRKRKRGRKCYIVDTVQCCMCFSQYLDNSDRIYNFNAVHSLLLCISLVCAFFILTSCSHWLFVSHSPPPLHTTLARSYNNFYDPVDHVCK